MYVVKVLGISLAVYLLVWASETCPSAPGGAACCLSGWERWNGSCYIFIPSMAWNEARSACQAWGGVMAAPRSQEENNFLAETADKTGIHWLWLACQNGTENWECGGREAGIFSNWREGEPSYFPVECPAMRTRDNDFGKWNDISCEGKAFHGAACVRRPNQLRSFCLPLGPDGRPLSVCLRSHVVHEFPTTTISRCGSACCGDPLCRSFNIRNTTKGGKICQLSDATRFDDPSKFENDGSFCLYFEV
ncbi:perlucin-like protein [Acanthaster planci]|uniref:Perlucin-like protein n=1 Tax=Acanthaster planci TaxID=133434 RepID=A0A8B7XIZ9_ACAPL|nr:perlucin-like protein [Acanthaster planci]